MHELGPKAVQGTLRPAIARMPEAVPAQLRDLVTLCTLQEAVMRPSIETVLSHLEDLLDNLRVVQAQERANKAAIMDRVFPPDIKRQLLEGRKVEPEQYDMIGVYFSDIVSAAGCRPAL